MKLRAHVRDTFRLLYPVRVAALGLAVSQVIGTVLVYLSNRTLAGKIAAVSAAGYGPLPGVHIDPSLSSLNAAFGGGFFFTLSTGAGVALLSFGAVLLVFALSSSYQVVKNRGLGTGWRVLALAVFLPASASLAALAIAWVILLVRGNLNGICYGLSAYLLLVPPVVIWAALKWSPRKSGYGRLPWRNPVHFALIAVLLALWTWRVDADVFVDFKDNLLLTSSPGIRIVHFYYRYTLYPAEVFKRPADRQIKTCVLEGFDNDLAGRLERVLRKHDYFVVRAEAAEPDLKVASRGEQLVLKYKEKSVIEVDRQRFLDSAGKVLTRFSEKSDSQAVFRKFTIFVLLGAAPLALYLATYAFFCLVPGIVTGIRVSSFLAPLLCSGFWIGVMMCLGTPAVPDTSHDQLAASIREGNLKERLSALRYIHENRLDISDFEGYRALLKADDFALRYWLIRNLGYSRDPGAAMIVSRFLESDSAYMVCKAIEAVAARAERSGTGGRLRWQRVLVRKIDSSDSWYVQFYAYKAARGLGWVPEKSG